MIKPSLAVLNGQTIFGSSKVGSLTPTGCPDSIFNSPKKTKTCESCDGTGRAGGDSNKFELCSDCGGTGELLENCDAPMLNSKPEDVSDADWEEGKTAASKSYDEKDPAYWGTAVKVARAATAAHKKVKNAASLSNSNPHPTGYPNERKNGSDLHPDDQKHVLAAYVHRYTGEHVPQWATKRRWDGSRYMPQHATDSDWLHHTTFAVNKDGRLNQKSTHAESTPSWPYGSHESSGKLPANIASKIP